MERSRRHAVAKAEVEDAYRRFGPSLLRRCRMILRDDALAEDALQEVFIRLLRYGACFDGPDARPLAWLYRVSDRVCFDLLKRSPVLAEVELAAPGNAEGFAEDRNLVLCFLRRLSSPERRVAVLYFVDELTQEEIAKELDCTRRTVYNRLQSIAKKVHRWGKRLVSLAEEVQP